MAYPKFVKQTIQTLRRMGIKPEVSKIHYDEYDFSYLSEDKEIRHSFILTEIMDDLDEDELEDDVLPSDPLYTVEYEIFYLEDRRRQITTPATRYFNTLAKALSYIQKKAYPVGRRASVQQSRLNNIHAMLRNKGINSRMATYKGKKIIIVE